MNRASPRCQITSAEYSLIDVIPLPVGDCCHRKGCRAYSPRRRQSHHDSTAKLKGEFEKRGVKVLGLSLDSVDDHIAWKHDIEQTQGANLYGMIHPNASDRFTARSVFVIDPKKKVRLTLNYPASTGRNFDEILRLVPQPRN
jgi:alkyl hydroperoxide reductase subunit AhpC